jgi:TfoX/Sxy family transcriptional regulator of competence genes
MPYSEELANRIRQRLSPLPNIEEKKMMGGLTFMYNDKMCVGIVKGELMCRIDPALHEMATAKPGCRTMVFTKRPMSGFVMISDDGMRTEKDFNYWIDLALDYNKRAKSSKKRR